MESSITINNNNVLLVKNKRINLLHLANTFVFHSKKNKLLFEENVNKMTLYDLQLVIIHNEFIFIDSIHMIRNAYVECGLPTEIALIHFCPKNDKAAYNQVLSFIKGETWKEIQKRFYFC